MKTMVFGDITPLRAVVLRGEASVGMGGGRSWCPRWS